MYGNDRFFEVVDDWVTVWIGGLGPEELDDYLDEPGGAGDNDPISKFANDLGMWYDHDFIYAEAADTPVPVRELCLQNDIDSVELVDEMERRGMGRKANCMIVLWNARVLEWPSRRLFSDGRLICIGSWEHVSPLK